MDAPLLGLFRFAYNQLSQEVTAAVAEVAPEQKPSYGNVMEQLDYRDGMRLTDLAKGAGMAPQSIGELVDQLEDLGMVERRPDPDDRRAKRVYLTDKAREAQRAALGAVMDTDRKIAELLGPERFARLRADVIEVIETFGGTIPTEPPEL